MKIFFLLPHPTNKPCGGYKIVYEYANRLSVRGNDVIVGYDCTNLYQKFSILFVEEIQKFLSIVISEIACRIFPRWFTLYSSVKKQCVYSKKDIPKCDCVVATAISTVDVILKCKYPKVYLIQGFENWHGVTEDEVYDSYRKIPRRIVISKWLKDIVDNHTIDGKTVYIRNAIDRKVFSLLKPIKDRNKYAISMLYHKNEYKESKYGIEVLCTLKIKYPQLKAVLFGVPRRPNGLPKWIDYVRNASQEELCNIYNQSAIFLMPSIKEGFGLTGLEAMACGCAVCSTDFEGVREYAINDVNALMSAPKDVESMVNNAKKLIDDDKLRYRIAGMGVDMSADFCWDNAIDVLEEFINI